MFARFLMIFAVMFVVTACSSTNEEGAMGEQSAMSGTDQRQGITDGTAYGSDVNGAAAGTVEDFVTNIGDRVFFGYDSYDLTSEARTVLEAQASWLMKYPSMNMTVEGHADERGTREYNLALGERRANAVQNYLVAMGVDPRRVKTVSYGKERPAVPGANEAAWAQNRRGVTRID